LGRKIPISGYLGLAVLLGLVLIQSSIGPFLTIVGVHPDLVLVAVISWTILRGPAEGLVWAIIGGIGLDLFSGGPFGVMTIALVITSLLASLGYGRAFGGYLILPLALTFPLSLVYYLSYTLFLSVLNEPIAWLPALTSVVLPASVINIVAMLFLFPPLRLLHRRTGREEIGW
jgi:rod shape-determining protein MreD